MKQKKTNIKIKKSKRNLYNKKKSKSRQTLTLVLTIVIACVLGVVGYGIGKPIVNYFQNRGQHTSDSSDDSNSSSDSVSLSEMSSSQPESSEPEVPPEPAVDDIKLYVLPIEATSSSAALGSALAAAKEAGYDTVAVTLKDEEGHFLFRDKLYKMWRDNEDVYASMLEAHIGKHLALLYDGFSDH